MPKATVRWFDPDKGFGFLALGEDSEDLFVHASEIQGGAEPKVLREGQEVEFELGEGDRGPVATRVRVTGANGPSGSLGVLGTVSWYEPTKGYGFASPEGGGPEIFVHSSAIVGGAVLSEGQRVAFLIVDGEKGPQADHLIALRSDAGGAGAGAAAADGADGTVSWFDTEKGFGFITPVAGGDDVFVHVRSLSRGLTELHEGDRVNYEVVPGDRGPQAREVRLARGSSPRGGGRDGGQRGGGRDFAQRGGARGDRFERGDRDRGDRFERGDRSDRFDRADRGNAPRAGERGQGVVTRYDADRGFGFISPEGGGPDLFVHASSLKHDDYLVEGDEVRYTVRQGDKGPQADQVERTR